MAMAEKEWKMRHAWIIVTVLSLIFAGSLAAFGAGQQTDKRIYQKQVEGTLKGLDQKIEQMKSMAAELDMAAKEKFEREMKVLQKKKKAADTKLEKLKSATDKTWEKTKTETDQALAELTVQYNRMMTRFKKP